MCVTGDRIRRLVAVQPALFSPPFPILLALFFSFGDEPPGVILPVVDPVVLIDEPRLFQRRENRAEVFSLPPDNPRHASGSQGAQVSVRGVIQRPPPQKKQVPDPLGMGNF